MEPAIPDYIHETVRSLPPLPAAVQRLLTLARDAEVNFREVSGVIECDQTLTARTLRAANSAFYGVPRRVETVRQATVLLGSDTIVNLALGISVLGLQDGMKQPWPLDTAAFWRHTLAVATAARMLALQANPDEADSAFVAGLLHDIGKLIMLEHFGDVYAQVLLAAQDGAQPLHELEHDILEVDHATVGYALCLHWNLPLMLTTAVAEHHATDAPAPHSIQAIVRDANAFVKLAQLGSSGNPYVPLHNPDLDPHHQVRPQALRTLLHDLPDVVRQAEEVFGQINGDPPARIASDAMVHLEITQPEERDVLILALYALGYTPHVLNDEALAFENGEGLPLCGLITDLPITPTRTFAYQRHEAAVLDYNAWRVEQDLPDAGSLNADALHAWLRGGLPRPAAARAA